MKQMNTMEKLRFGMSTCGCMDLTEKDFEAYAGSGVKEIELACLRVDYERVDWKGIEQRAKKSGIGLWSLHLPFVPIGEIDIANADNEKRLWVVNALADIVERSADIGIKIMVVHPSAEPYLGETRDAVMERAQDSLVRLADTAERYGAVIAVENLPRMCLGRDSQELNRLISVDDRLRVCFDTNHVLSQPISEFICDIGNKIVTTHFSDCDFKNERHWLPGEGEINWVEVIESLNHIKYQGPLMYELDFEAYPTIDRQRLTCEDFKNNYYCLINNLPLKAIGIPVRKNCTPWETTMKH